MYDDTVRHVVARLVLEGLPIAEIQRRTGVSTRTIRRWRERADRVERHPCPRCHDRPLAESSYAALLGFYLGDGCISRMGRAFALRVFCDASQTRVVADVTECVRVVHPTRPIFHVRAPGVTVVQSSWEHWPCLFPQHGAGRKHERRIVLADWQRAIVARHPAALLRGLFHSDGCRSINTIRRVVAGEQKSYEYPRWQFTNVSDDIRTICTDTLDLLSIAWRRSNAKTISVSRRADVARLDRLIGAKR